MFFILGWLIYGLIVGLLSKWLHPGDDPIGFLPTVGIGIAGSFIGGALNWILGYGGSPLSSSGIVMGTIGGIIFCFLYSMYKKSQAGEDKQ